MKPEKECEMLGIQILPFYGLQLFCKPDTPESSICSRTHPHACTHTMHLPYVWNGVK